MAVTRGGPQRPQCSAGGGGRTISIPAAAAGGGGGEEGGRGRQTVSILSYNIKHIINKTMNCTGTGSRITIQQ